MKQENVLPKNPIEDSIIYLNMARVKLVANRAALQGTKNPGGHLADRIEKLSLAISMIHDAIQVLHQHEGPDYAVQTHIPF